MESRVCILLRPYLSLLILVPDREKWTAEELSLIVRDVNREQVEPEERLSDHAYYYDLEKGAIEIAA